MKELLHSLVQAYVGGREAPVDRSSLASNFVFALGEIESTREEFPFGMGSLAMGDVVVRAILVDQSEAAVFFDGTDTVCGVRYQFAWLVAFDATSIRKITEVRTHVISLKAPV